MQKMDFGYHTSLTQTLNIHNTATSCLVSSDQDRLDAFVNQSRSIIAAHDNAHFRSQYQKLFIKPEDFEFQPHKGDEVSRNNHILLHCYSVRLFMNSAQMPCS